jgi:hypothetical protein
MLFERFSEVKINRNHYVWHRVSILLSKYLRLCFTISGLYRGFFQKELAGNVLGFLLLNPRDGNCIVTLFNAMCYVWSSTRAN